MTNKCLLLVTVLIVALCWARTVTRSELDEALLAAGADKANLSTWDCIVEHESGYHTEARRAGDHGIFQINQKYWCSTTDKPGKGCNMTCASLRTDNIKDAVKCALIVYEETKKLPNANGDGFTAWRAYNEDCKKDRT